MTKKPTRPKKSGSETPEAVQEPEQTQEQVQTLEQAPAVPVIDAQSLMDELAEARRKAEEYLDGWQRSRAEFANYKKRTERETAQAYQTAAGNLSRRYLGVLDDLERALKNRPSQGEGAAWADGIELVYRKFTAILESEGITPMNPLGEQFDPNLHEAVMSEDSDQHESGQVMEVLQQGFMLGDRVLRPAMVRVAR
jgi:molecular chaperone GrpE